MSVRLRGSAAPAAAIDARWRSYRTHHSSSDVARWSRIQPLTCWPSRTLRTHFSRRNCASPMRTRSSATANSASVASHPASLNAAIISSKINGRSASSNIPPMTAASGRPPSCSGESGRSRSTVNLKVADGAWIRAALGVIGRHRHLPDLRRISRARVASRSARATGSPTWAGGHVPLHADPIRFFALVWLMVFGAARIVIHLDEALHNEEPDTDHGSRLRGRGDL